ncbi:hypothetical protein Tco_0523784 [Tanacetum coccineum]
MTVMRSYNSQWAFLKGGRGAGHRDEVLQDLHHERLLRNRQLEAGNAQDQAEGAGCSDSCLELLIENGLQSWI